MDGKQHIRRLAGLLLLAGIACGTACSGGIPAPRLPEPPPPALSVDGEALSAVAFDEVLLEVPDHLTIGYHHVGLERSRVSDYRWGPDFRAGRPALDADLRTVMTSAGYRLDADDPGAVRLVARLVKVGIDSYDYKTVFEQASCEVVWELWGAGAKRPYFVRTTTGGGRVEVTGQGAVLAAFDAALHRLLADEEFVAALRPAGDGR